MVRRVKVFLQLDGAAIEYWISISRQELTSISSMPSAKIYLVRKPYSAISV
jgi:hypothetical protein